MKTTMTVMLIGLVMGFGTSIAQAHPLRGKIATSLEGTWRVQITLRDCDTLAPLGQPFDALASFNAGGTVLTADGSMSPAARSTGHGVWRRLGKGHYSATIEAFLFANGVRSGTQRLVQEIAMAPDGQSYDSSVGAAIFNTAGQVVFSGCASAVGQRMD
jgi:hypothetical protein